MTMKIISEGRSYRVPDNHSYAHAIMALVKAYDRGDFITTELPVRNDIKQLWKTLRDGHRDLLGQSPPHQPPDGPDHARVGQARLRLDAAEAARHDSCDRETL